MSMNRIGATGSLTPGIPYYQYTEDDKKQAVYFPIHKSVTALLQTKNCKKSGIVAWSSEQDALS